MTILTDNADTSQPVDATGEAKAAQVNAAKALKFVIDRVLDNSDRSLDTGFECALETATGGFVEATRNLRRLQYVRNPNNYPAAWKTDKSLFLRTLKETGIVPDSFGVDSYEDTSADGSPRLVMHRHHEGRVPMRREAGR